MPLYGNIFDRGMLNAILFICKCCFIKTSSTRAVCTLFVEMGREKTF